jgi:hypothetical protein
MEALKRSLGKRAEKKKAPARVERQRVTSRQHRKAS